MASLYSIIVKTSALFRRYDDKRESDPGRQRRCYPLLDNPLISPLSAYLQNEKRGDKA